MIRFRQKTFSEYDAMRSLYVELMKNSDRRKFRTIDSSQLIPVLKGNNVVIERFVISTSFGHHDKYRMYLKIGAKAKLPDEVRLQSQPYDKTLLRLNMRIGRKVFSDTLEERVFAKDEKKGNNNNNNNDDGNSFGIGGSIPCDINIIVNKLQGEVIKYDKPSRSLVLEFDKMYDAINALNLLPFGIRYDIYLLDA